MTPIVTRRIAVTTVAAASFWKRVNELLGRPVGSGRGWRRERCGAGAILPPRPCSPFPAVRADGHAFEHDDHGECGCERAAVGYGHAPPPPAIVDGRGCPARVHR